MTSDELEKSYAAYKADLDRLPEHETKPAILQRAHDSYMMGLLVIRAKSESIQ